MLLYSCHLPKTGGTSILYSYNKCFGNKKIFRIGKAGVILQNREFIDFCLRKDITKFNLNKFKHISGHANDSRLLTFLDLNPLTFKIFLIIRDPLSLFWSQYYQSTIDGKKKFTPEQFLEKRGNSGFFDFYKNKFSALTGKNNNLEFKELLMLFNYIFETKDLTKVIGTIEPDLKNSIRNKRRVRSLFKGFKPHPYQGDPEFNEKIVNFKDIDNEFYLECKKCISKDGFSNKLFDPSYLEDSFKNLKLNYPKEDVREYFRNNVLKKFLRKKYESDKFNKINIIAWNTLLKKYSTNIEELIS